MAIRGVAFDLEGTVVNVEPAHHLGHILCAAECGVDLLETGLCEKVGEDKLSDPVFLSGLHRTILDKMSMLMEKLPCFVGGGNPSNASLISKMNGRMSEKEVRALKVGYYKLLVRRIPIACRPGSLEAIRWFKDHGFPIAIGSLTEDAEAFFFLKESGLLCWFDEKRIVLRNSVKNLKPAPDVFLKTAERMSIDPREQIVFDDSPNGVLAARTAGSVAVGMPVYDSQDVVSSLVKAGAKRVFMDWREMNLDALIRNLNG